MKQEPEIEQTHDNDGLPMGGASTMPVTGACCGIRPSKEAMETDFEIDFSKANQFLAADLDIPSNQAE